MANPIPIRKPEFDFSEVPKDWAHGDQQLTHVLNGLCALFPDGEKFFCRSVRHYEKQVSVDPERLRGFYGQEAHHGAAHRKQFEMLEAQGYEIESWLEWYRTHAYKGIAARTPQNISLASTAALEHFTASLAEVALDPNDLVEGLHPEIQALLRWHASEEIEHKSVAFDVLQEVDPRLRLRLLGFGMASVTLLLYGMSASRHLAKQDGIRGTRRRLIKELVRRPKVWRGALDFCRRSFHPDDHDNYGLAEAWFASVAEKAA